jgi:hypothetical protein
MRIQQMLLPPQPKNPELQFIMITSEDGFESVLPLIPWYSPGGILCKKVIKTGEAVALLF